MLGNDHPAGRLRGLATQRFEPRKGSGQRPLLKLTHYHETGSPAAVAHSLPQRRPGCPYPAGTKRVGLTQCTDEPEPGRCVARFPVAIALSDQKVPPTQGADRH